MLKRLLHDVVKDDADLEEKLSSSNLLPLVRELNHKYGLVVYEENRIGRHVHDRDDFLLTDGQGLPIARIFIDDESYCFHAPYTPKERGSDDFDRHTFRSKKLSTLMSTLKRCAVVSSSDEVLDRGGLNYQMGQLVDRVISSFTYQRKDNLNGDDVHKLLLLMQQGKSLNDLQQSDRDNYLELLDKYNQADILSSRRKQGTEEMFEDTYLVFGDACGHYIVAEAGYEYNKHQQLAVKPKTPFKRVKDLTEYPRILTALTMNKVHAGEEFKPFNSKDSLVPVGDKFIPDLELVYGYRSRNSAFDMGMVCLSK